MNRIRTFLLLLCCTWLASSLYAERPNVLFIAVDDLNDWVGHLGGHPQAATPNIDRLAAQGVAFTRAYCSAPLCNPSRVSLLTGVEPSRSGVFGNSEKLREQLPDAVTLMQYLRRHGYTAKGGGKIFHGANRSGDAESWDYYHQVRTARAKPLNLDGLPDSVWAPWGPIALDDDEMLDGKVVNWAISELKKKHEKPFFLACGFTKPHLPWYVPKKYFDLHPLDNVVLPNTLDTDRDDLPSFGLKLAKEVHTISNGRNFAKHGEDHDMVLQHNQWPRAVQSYLATVSFVDHHVGRLLDALSISEHAKNTIVVLWGDHGWHLGEKQHWRKHALWETTTRTTLILWAPGAIAKHQQCHRPVSLIDLYPTLIELSGLPKPNNLDGQSLVPLLQDPTRAWNRPALTTFGKGNHALRTERWRFIGYHDGGEELYDHDSDPNEWHNLARSKDHTTIVRMLREALQKRLAEL